MGLWGMADFGGADSAVAGPDWVEAEVIEVCRPVGPDHPLLRPHVVVLRDGTAPAGFRCTRDQPRLSPWRAASTPRRCPGRRPTSSPRTCSGPPHRT
jgi:hypothetical protein